MPLLFWFELAEIGWHQQEEWEVLFLTGFTLGLGLKNWVLVLVLPLNFLADSTDVSSSPCGLTFAT